MKYERAEQMNDRMEYKQRGSDLLINQDSNIGQKDDKNFESIVGEKVPVLNPIKSKQQLKFKDSDQDEGEDNNDDLDIQDYEEGLSDEEEEEEDDDEMMSVEENQDQFENEGDYEEDDEDLHMIL